MSDIYRFVNKLSSHFVRHEPVVCYVHDDPVIDKAYISITQDIFIKVYGIDGFWDEISISKITDNPSKIDIMKDGLNMMAYGSVLWSEDELERISLDTNKNNEFYIKQIETLIMKYI